MAIKPRFLRDIPQSFFLFGPRGTGKSTWLKRHMPGAFYIDLLAPDVFRFYSAKPERLKERIDALPDFSTVVIDEIQKLPELLDVVHMAMEERKGARFVLTGSSARKLKRSGVDLLAGRAALKKMHPFMAAETPDSFRLSNALKTGMVPLVAESPNPSETLDAYAALYVKEEVQAEGLVRNIGAFNRFLESVSFSNASVLNISDVARDCQAKRKTVEGYISIIEDLMLAFRIPVFSKRAKRRLSSHPKFFFFDSGVFRALRPSGPLDAPSEIDGGALELLVAQHLRAWADYSGEKCGLYFWRTKSGLEVDFVLYGQKTFCAIEVKNASKINAKTLKGLKSFGEEYPEADLCLLYRGKETRVIQNIPCVPCDVFLKNLKPGSPVSSCFFAST